MGRRPRIAICDLLLCWPPDSGAFVDVVATATRLAREAEVLLLVPRITQFLQGVATPMDLVLRRFSRFFERGAINGELPIPYRHIPFTAVEFIPQIIGRRYRRALREFAPDVTLISNGWHLKPHLVLALAEFKPLLRIYAHEMLCIKVDGRFFRRGKICERDMHSGSGRDFLECVTCSAAFYAGYPGVRALQEHILSGAFFPGYVRTAQRGMATASAVIVYNEWTAKRVRRHNPNTVVIPAGVDTGRFKPTLAPPSSDNIAVVVTGRVWQPHKGRNFLKRVASRMAVARPSVRFHVTGEHPSLVGSNIVQVPWRDQNDLPGLYQQAHIAFVPSLWPEPQGIVALEASASGLPVVVTQVGGLQDLVKSGETGYVVPPGDVDRAVEALCCLADDAALRQRLGRQGRALCEAQHNWDDIFTRHYAPLFEPTRR